MKFIKCHSYGNYFIIAKFKKFNYKNILKMCNYKVSIGFDQIIFIKKYFNKRFFIKIFNKDGTRAFNCINGIRCVGYYIINKIGVNKINIVVNKNINFVVIKKGSKIFIRSNIINIESKIKKFNHKYLYLRNLNKNIQFNFFLIKNFYFNIFYLGNNHLIIIKNIFFKKKNILFLKNVFFYFNFLICDINFSIFNIKNRKIITLERGSGFTNSCGSATKSCCILLNKIIMLKRIRVINNIGSVFYFKKKNINIIKGKVFMNYLIKIKI